MTADEGGTNPSTDRPDPLEELVRLHDPLRQAMICFFQRRRLEDPEGLAAEVFVRVLRKLRGGLSLECPIERYCWRVARFVCLEQFRQRKTEELTDTLHVENHPLLGLLPVETATLYRECMDLLSDVEIEFVQKYLHADKQLLAAEMSTNAGAMATRFCKLKKRIEESIRTQKRQK